MIHIPHLLTYVIQPTLDLLPETMRGRAVERLLLGTALTESGGKYLAQIGGGPALGIFQMEPATHDDIWNNYLRFEEALGDTVNTLVAAERPSRWQLTWNLRYAAAMARIHYWRDSQPLPTVDDLTGLSYYWKRVYNTDLGAGQPEKFAALLTDAIDRYEV